MSDLGAGTSSAAGQFQPSPSGCTHHSKNIDDTRRCAYVLPARLAPPGQSIVGSLRDTPPSCAVPRHGGQSDFPPASTFDLAPGPIKTNRPSGPDTHVTGMTDQVEPSDNWCETGFHTQYSLTTMLPASTHLHNPDPSNPPVPPYHSNNPAHRHHTQADKLRP